jgi:nucleotide-binding universal stress UspA family protein
MLLVPYDGSALATAALERASELADATGGDLLALTVVPDDAGYARERGWLEQGDAFDGDVIERRLRQQVEDVAPEADFRTVVTRRSTDPVATLEIEIARTVRAVAADEDADVVVVGSENAGRVASPLTSVGSPVSDDPRYDVYIVRHRR